MAKKRKIMREEQEKKIKEIEAIIKEMEESLEELKKNIGEEKEKDKSQNSDSSSGVWEETVICLLL